MSRNLSTIDRQPLQGLCVFVRGSMLAAGTWVQGGKRHSVLGSEHAFVLPDGRAGGPAPGEWGVEAE